MRMGKALPPYRNKRVGSNSCFITIPQAILRENNLPDTSSYSNKSRVIKTPISEELIRASYGFNRHVIVTDDELTTVSQLNALFRVIALLSRVPVLARDQTTKEKKDRGHVESEKTKNRKA
ncbi:hypothetical protein AX14_002389, partial [Amanita brunnescens Koide BX004]